MPELIGPRAFVGRAALVVDRCAGSPEIGQQGIDGVVIERIDLAPAELGREALRVPVRQQPHDDHGLAHPVRQTGWSRASRTVDERLEPAGFVACPPAVQARPAGPEIQGGPDALLAGDAHTAGPPANLREPRVGRPDWRAATPHREEQEVRPLLVGVAEQATAGIAPMLGLELIHAPTLEPHPTPCLIIPGNYT